MMPSVFFLMVCCDRAIFLLMRDYSVYIETLCQEAVQCDLAKIALGVVENWEFNESKEQIKLCKAALSVLLRIASTGL
jgi:hypothetical protein